MNETIKFFTVQTKLELFMAAYFLTLLAYMILVFMLKQKNKKSLSIFMLKRKNLLCGITYLILVFYLAAGCLVLKIINNILVYSGIMALAALAVNYLYVLGYGVKKIKDLEFSDIYDTYDEIVDYCSLADNITCHLTNFVSYLSCVEEDEINEYSFEQFNETWESLIQDYLKERIEKLDYLLLNKDKKVLFNYVKNLCVDLWYEDEQINRFVESLMNGEEVILDAGKRLIPISSKRFSCLVFVQAKENSKRVEDIDRNFIVNTYCIMSLL